MTDNAQSPSNSVLPEPRKNYLIVIAAIVIISTLLLAYFFISRSEAIKKPDSDADTPMMVRQADHLFIPEKSPLRQRLVIESIKPAAPIHTIELPGIVEADPSRTVSILPPLTGRIISLKVKLGDKVTAGQVVASISSPDLAQAFADADKARDAQSLALHALERARGVNSAGANATKDLEQAESNVTQAKAESNRAGERLKTLGIHTIADENNHLLNVTTPQSGTVTALNIGAGAYINDATASIMTISNLDNVWITANVPEELIATIHRGQAADVTLSAYSGQHFQGKIDFLSAIIEPDTRRNKARISFTNTDGKFKPNMFANVTLAIAQTSKISIPTSALLMNNDNTTVFIEVAPWTFVRRTVELGKEDNEQVSILSGLSNGEHIIVRGGVLLND